MGSSRRWWLNQDTHSEGIHNRIRRHSHLDQLSPLTFEQLRNGNMSTEPGEVHSGCRGSVRWNTG